MTEKRAVDVVIDALARLGSTDPSFDAARRTAVLMLAGIDAPTNSKAFAQLGRSTRKHGVVREVTGRGLRWKGADMRTTLAVLTEARRIVEPAAPTGPAEICALDQVIAALDKMAVGSTLIAKGGSA